MSEIFDIIKSLNVCLTDVTEEEHKETRAEKIIEENGWNFPKFDESQKFIIPV